jgi:glutamate-1-semialdehyde aminotransferase
MEREDVIGDIWAKGEKYMKAVGKIIEDADVGAELTGIPPMSFITFAADAEKKYKDKRMDFYTQLIRRKVFMQPYHHGYICYRHTDEDLKYTVAAIEECLQYLKKKY